jgi:apolipoprotein N-acyltransferase
MRHILAVISGGLALLCISPFIYVGYQLIKFVVLIVLWQVFGVNLD